MVNNLNSKTILRKARASRSYVLGLICVFSLLLLLPFVSSAPPVTQVQQFTEGYIIEGNPQEIIEFNQTYQFNFFVYNISNGNLITNTSATCVFYMANNYGEVIIYKNVPYYSTGYWGLVIDKGNFSSVGHYNYGTKCNSSNYGGALIGYFTATPTGYELDIPQAIIYIFGISFFFIIFLMFLYGSFKVSFKHQNMQGTLGFIKQYRVLKIACIMFTYLTALMLSALLMQVTGLIWYYGSLNRIFSYIYTLLLSGVFPIGILAIFLSLIVFVHDYLFNKKLKKLFGKGGNPFGEV